jgi:hypothetical protein
MVARARYGSGKVAAIGDSSPCDDGTGDGNDQLYTGYTGDANGNHRKLLMNITIWLAESDVSTVVENSQVSQNNLGIFPNPSAGHFSISFKGNVNTGFVRILNAFGQEVFEQDISNEVSKDINPEGISAGIYFVEVFNGENYYVRKLIIQ